MSHAIVGTDGGVMAPRETFEKDAHAQEALWKYTINVCKKNFLFIW